MDGDVVGLSQPSKESREHLCRVCLQYDSTDILDIFSEQGMEYNLDRKLQLFLQLTITRNDVWPSKLCSLCVERLENWNSYFEMAKQNERLLYSWFGSAHNLMIDQVVLNEEDMTDENATVSADMADMHEDVVDVKNILDSGDTGYKSEVIDTTAEENVIVVDEDCSDQDEKEEVEEEDTKSDADFEPSEGAGDNAEDTETDNDNEPNTSKTRANTRKREKKPQEVSNAAQRALDDEMIRKVVVIECAVCFQQFENFDILSNHMRTKHHEPQGYLTCCEKKFKRRYVLLEHARLHINPDAYACPVCKKRFSTKRHLMDHTPLHVPENERQFNCDQCEKRYSTKYRLMLHMKSHNEELSFTCPHCNKSFRQKNILNNHIKSVHEMCNARICEICARVFKTKEGFLTHQIVHMEKAPPPLQCEICGSKYKNRDSLKYHLMRHRRADDRFNCDICNKEFKCRKRMRAHRKYVHATEKFKCTLCEKEFKRPIVLKEHMATHTGEVLYMCAYCPKQFNSNANKYSHQKTQHPTEWAIAKKQKNE